MAKTLINNQLGHRKVAKSIWQMTNISGAINKTAGSLQQTLEQGTLLETTTFSGTKHPINPLIPIISLIMCTQPSTVKQSLGFYLIILKGGGRDLLSPCSSPEPWLPVKTVFPAPIGWPGPGSAGWTNQSAGTPTQGEA